jgi:hypothetical protein
MCSLEQEGKEESKYGSREKRGEGEIEVRGGGIEGSKIRVKGRAGRRVKRGRRQGRKSTGRNNDRPVQYSHLKAN